MAELQETIKETLFKLIKDNLKTTESDTIIEIITEYEELKEENKELKKEVEKLEKLIEEEVEKKEFEKKGNIELQEINDKLEKKVKDINNLKEKEKELGLRNQYLSKSYNDMMALVQIVFKTPSKIKEFNLPMMQKTYSTYYDNNNNAHSEVIGEYPVNTYGNEKENVDYEDGK